MRGKAVASSHESKESRARREASRLDPLVLVEGLDRLQETLIRRLDGLERLVVEQDEFYQMKPSERERLLREKISSLEASLARLQAENKRREQEWQTFLEQLEEDRRLLADAWSRLERAQIEAATATPERTPMVSGSSPRQPSAPHEATPAPTPGAGVGAAATRAAPLDPATDPVAQSILRQFQTMQNDVRRNAKERPRR